ncbi:MAG: tRNA (N6-threonylcarbamoyladenosine(37)-N6)-methyltransferase TrmO [Spirochaetia bacterium]|nr:tRNA (N6-threonylcarbamoyladenosine(37)-N6)-methyltransferase TrmO [Spirochaetia bacterium]
MVLPMYVCDACVSDIEKESTMEITYQSVGVVKASEGFRIELEKEYCKALMGLQGFSHVMVIWHAHDFGNAGSEYLVFEKPYVHGPEKIGVYATRSPFRPNGICASIAKLVDLDVEQGVLILDWIDAQEGTPILDIKPYHGSEDRIRDVEVPSWCSHWPSYREDSATFDWDQEFSFSQE